MKVGIIGYGHVGKKHAEVYRAMDEIKDIVIYDPYLGTYPSAEYQFFDSKKMELISICTPSDIRQEIIGKCALRDYNILVEKPLALTMNKAQQIIDTCHENNVILAVVMQKRFNPAVQQLCGEVRARTLGKPLMASVVVRWYRPRAYYAGWQGEEKQGGSILINQAIHFIDLLQWIMGPAESVFGHTEKLRGPLNTTDAVVATLKFISGAIATLEVSTIAYPKNAGESLTVLSEWGHRVVDTSGNFHEPVIRNFVECVREMKEPMVTGEESLKSLKIALAIQRSSDNGEEVFL